MERSKHARRRLGLWGAFLLLNLSFARPLPGDEETAPLPPALESRVDFDPIRFGESHWASDGYDEWSLEGGVRLTALQPQPLLVPPAESQPQTPLPQAARIAADLLASRPGGSGPVTPAQWASPGLLSDHVPGTEAIGAATMDAGSLLGQSPAALGVGLQRRTPVVNDPRIRGSRIGQLAASGSYWVPARIDLDTILSKIDSSLVERMDVIKGPYSVRDGPGFLFLDVELLRSPRFDQPQMHGSTGVNYKSNGEQLYGRQNIWGGGRKWGFRAGYGHSTGNDYASGSGELFPSSYNSREADVAFGFDPAPQENVEINGLRLDQTNLEFPGYAFDLDWLVTDAFEASYSSGNCGWTDLLTFDTWYNRTRFAGDAQRPGKREQFPFLDLIQYVGYTNADTISTGYRLASTWGDPGEPQFTAGIDLRFLGQELNELGSGRLGFTIFENANSPIPRSDWTNPGVFLEQRVALNERIELVVGARADLAYSRVTDDPAKLAHLGLQSPDLQSSLADILGTDEFDQTRAPWGVFATTRTELTPNWHVSAGIGHGERPPSLTELYVAQTFLFVLQNGLNDVTGDPLLRSERVTQIDLGLDCHYPRLRAGAHGFFVWANDYITFENMGVFYGPPEGDVIQENLKYVNTELATFIGAEGYVDYDWNSWLTPFATLKYVAGEDWTRNGRFATQAAAPGQPSERVYGLPRGYFSGIDGADSEPLPGILPLEGRLGLRFHPPGPKPAWNVEVSARVVDAQTRVATSLLETPTPGFTVFDLRSSWAPSDRLLLLAGVENFTDVNYREHLDFRSPTYVLYQPGITFYGGAKLRY